MKKKINSGDDSKRKSQGGNCRAGLHNNQAISEQNVEGYTR